MFYLESIFGSVLQLTIFFIAAKIMQNLHYTRKDYTWIALIAISSWFMYLIANKFALIYICICALFFLYRKQKALSIFTIIILILIHFVSNFIALWLTFSLKKHSNISEFVEFSVYALIFATLPLLGAWIVKVLLEKLSNTYLYKSKYFLSILSVFIIITFSLLYHYTPKEVETSGSLESFRLIAIIYIIFSLIMALGVTLISITVIREVRYKRNIKEMEDYYNYTLKIEGINNEMRKFRHDYINILSTMSEYIRERDMEGLETYFNEQIVPLKDNLQSNAIKLSGIENLKVREIKGLLTTKILQAQEKNIHISIEVSDPITEINMNIIELSRAIGIILDNAIEASDDIDDAMIQIAFIKTDNAVNIIFMNKCAPDIPKVHTLFKESFSTKGKNRGLGLSTLKEITDSTTNVLLDTTIENNYFIQKIEILNDNI